MLEHSNVFTEVETIRMILIPHKIRYISTSVLDQSIVATSNNPYRPTICATLWLVMLSILSGHAMGNQNLVYGLHPPYVIGQ